MLTTVYNSFIFNRLWAAVKREILLILAEGVSDAAEIDRLFGIMFQASVLPCQLMDRVGLDTVAFIEDNYINERHLDGSLTVDWLRSNYIQQGKLGLKTPEQGGLYPPASVAVNPPLNSSVTTQEKQMPPLFLLDVGLGSNSPSYPSLSGISTNGKILRLDAPNQPPKALVTGLPAPDGIDVDPSADRMYWTNMGADVNARDGSLMSSRLDGTDKRVLLSDGVLTTPKQLILVKDPLTQSEKLYFCDREGCSVHRCNVDGSEHEVLVQNPGSAADVKDWCVGITVDLKTRKFYWTQKGPSKSNLGRIYRANIDFLPGENGSNRSDIEVVFDKLPEPIDLEIESESGVLYWTDRGEHPRGSSLNCARVENDGKQEVKILARHFHEPIGLKLDLQRKQIFVSDLGGSVYSVDVETGKKTVVHRDEGSYTGIVTLPEA